MKQGKGVPMLQLGMQAYGLHRKAESI